MTSTDVVCCDANLVVRLFTEPEAANVRAQWAEWLRVDTVLVAPPLLRYEVTNAIHRFGRAGKVPLAQTRLLLREALDVTIELRDVPGMHERALEFARQFDLPAAYDAHYLALSQILGCDFYTSDAKLHRGVERSLPWVRLIK